MWWCSAVQRKYTMGEYTMRATGGLPLPSNSSRTCRTVIMAWAKEGVGWPGLGGLTLADSFTLTQREKYLDSVVVFPGSRGLH